MILALVISVITIALSDLLGNVLALLLEGRPKETWLLNTLISIYAQDTTSAALMVFFTLVSFFLVVDFCLHFCKQLVRRARTSDMPIEIEHRFTPRTIPEVIWLISGSLIIVLISLLLYLPFVGNFPGGDTPSYIGSMHQLEHYGILWSVYSQKRPIVSLIFYLLYSAISKLQYLVGITFTIIIYILLSSFIFSLFSLLLLRKLGIGKFSSILSVSAGYVIWIFRFSGDLYAQYLAYALMYAFAYFYINSLEGKERDGVVSGIILSLIFFIHEQSAYIIVLVATISFLLYLVYNKGKWQRARFPVVLCFLTTCVILLPFLFLAINDSGYLGIFSTMVGPVEERYGSFATTSSYLSQKISLNDYDILASKQLLSGFPNIFGYCLILLGIILISPRFNKKCCNSTWALLQSWSIVLIAGMLMGSMLILIRAPNILSTAVWRLGLLMPIPLLLGTLVNFASTFNGSLLIRIIIKTTRTAYIQTVNYKLIKLIAICILMIATILSLNSSIQYMFYYSGSPKPSEFTIEDALAIRSIFGYGNRSVIVYVQNNDGRKVEWISALTGMNIFYGRNILDLYLGKVDEQLSGDVVYRAWTHVLQKAGLFGNISRATIVTAETFGTLGPLETELISQRIDVSNGSRIYIFRYINRENVSILYELSNQLYNADIIVGQQLNGKDDFWKVYRIPGAKVGHEATINRGETPTQAYKITLTRGNYYIRLYHIFDKPQNFSSYKYLRLIIYCQVQNGGSKNFMLSVASDMIGGGESLNRGEYTFTCASGEKKVVLIPLSNLKQEGELNISAVTQIIFYLDRDQTIANVTISEITLIK